jgi:hypothetical protein
MHKTVLYAILNPYTKQKIVEWKSPQLFTLKWISFEIILIFSILTLIKNLKQKELKDAFLLLFFIILPLNSLRHIPLFAILSPSFIIIYLDKEFEKLKNIFQYGLSFFVVGLGLSIVVILTPKKFDVYVDTKTYPVGAVKFIKENKLKGNIFNPFGWGEYLIWHLYPDVRVSIDGRYDTVYPMSLIKKQFTPLISKDKKEISVPFEEKTDLILLEKGKLLRKKLDLKVWKLVYEDKTASVFVKKRKKNLKVIKRLKKISYSLPPYTFFP